MIKSERLLIRPIVYNDWRAIQNIWIDESLSQYAKYDKPNKIDDLSVKKRIEMWAFYEGSDEHFFWAVCLRDVVIGYVNFNKTNDYYEMGYCFHSHYHGHGYARESVIELLSYMKRENINCIVARTAIANEPSIKLLNYVGFEKKGLEMVSFYEDKCGHKIYFEGGIFEMALSKEYDCKFESKSLKSGF